MKQEIVLEDSVTRGGVRKLHVVGAERVEVDAWRERGYIPEGAMFLEEKRWQDAQGQHWVATWMAREVIRWTFTAQPLVVRQVVLWHVGAGKVSKAIFDGAVAYAIGIGRGPLVAFLRQIPVGAEEGMEVYGVALVQADWVPVGFVFLDGGGERVEHEGREKARKVRKAEQMQLEAHYEYQ